MALFAVADIHGYFDQTKKALEEAGFFESPENKLVLVGDALDRGKQVRETVDFLLNLHREGRLIYVFGNHEELLDQCLQDIASGALALIASPPALRSNSPSEITIYPRVASSVFSA